jgi:hypothetical protein
MAIDYNSPIGQVRSLTGDTDEEHFFMSDEEIEAILLIFEGNILLSAAHTCDAMAMKVTMQMGTIQTLDFQFDADKMAKTFMNRGKELRHQHELSGDMVSGDIEFIEVTGYPFYRPPVIE